MEILRLSHRIERDKRLTSHTALIARALGADIFYYTGQKDAHLENSIEKITKNFGGNFKIQYRKDPKEILKDKIIVHLTMYGLPIQKQIKKIRKEKKIIVVIGSEKVPTEYYKIAHYNIAVTSQPQSEAGALALFLHEYFKGKELQKEFKNARLKVIPQQKSKKVVKSDSDKVLLL